MAKKNSRNTKGKIVSAAWKLFYEQGYDDTTIEEIVDLSGTSKGSFYHYFDGKDALLGSLAYLFDEKYEELDEQIDPEQSSIEVLFFLNRELFKMIENSIDIDLLTRLLSTQLVTKGNKELLDRNRVYFKLLNKIVERGQQDGTITDSMSRKEIVRLYAMCERALLYDWCLRKGEYPLTEYSQSALEVFLKGLKK